MAQLGRRRLSKPYPRVCLIAWVVFTHPDKTAAVTALQPAHPPPMPPLARPPPNLHQPLPPPSPPARPSPPAADRVPASCHRLEEDDDWPTVQRRRPPRPPLRRGGRPARRLHSGHRCAAAASPQWPPSLTTTGARGRRPVHDRHAPPSFSGEQPMWHPYSLLSLRFPSNSPSLFSVCRHDSGDHT
jgi:hypothetical protein